MKKNIALLGALTGLAMSAATANAAKIIVPLGAPDTNQLFFRVTSDPTDLSSVTATFGATTFGASKAFDYAFTFTLPTSGIGSGSLSASFGGSKSAIDVTKVIIDNVSYTPVATSSGQSLTVGGVAITAGVLNTIEVFGTTGPKARQGIFSGNASFETSAVPEPATWATFLLGFGFMGVGLRRKLAAKRAFA